MCTTEFMYDGIGWCVWRLYSISSHSLMNISFVVDFEHRFVARHTLFYILLGSVCVHLFLTYLISFGFFARCPAFHYFLSTFWLIRYKVLLIEVMAFTCTLSCINKELIEKKIMNIKTFHKNANRWSLISYCFFVSMGY